MNDQAVLSVKPLGFPWETPDPFLFCVYHEDTYPKGNEILGPDAPLAGREIGMDFEGLDGWRMYHGDVVPGFPRHPHRGFETVTIARRGFIDHSDSLGATARFGGGDVQWMTAGRGIVHAEMFPLLDQNGPNPLEMFQIWLNLPGADKLVEPYFTMLWSHTIPTVTFRDAAENTTAVTVIAGKLGEVGAPSPPPGSWAARPDSEVAIWTIKMEPHAQWVLPGATQGLNRTLYFFQGDGLHIGETPIAPASAVQAKPEDDLRHEFALRDPSGLPGLSAHRIRRMALAERRSGSSVRRRPPRPAPRRPHRTARLNSAGEGSAPPSDGKSRTLRA